MSRNVIAIICLTAVFSLPTTALADGLNAGDGLTAPVTISETSPAPEVRHDSVAHPFYAGALHVAEVDMVFYIDPTDKIIDDPDSAYEVYATFARGDERYRERLVLTDGERSEMLFGDQLFAFERAGRRLHAEVETLPADQDAYALADIPVIRPTVD